MARLRDWVESDHPRWPRGSGDKSGEFRDKNGGDWAERLSGKMSDAVLPAGRYGSVATGQTAQCPVCGRTVKVVGTSGKLSTHNISKGQRCDGSGQTVSQDSKKAGGVVARRAAKKLKSKQIKAPEPPKVTVGASQGTIDDPQARARFRRWQDGAAAPGAKPGTMTRREMEIGNARRMVESRRYGMPLNRQAAERAMRQQMQIMGYDPDNLRDRQEYGWNDELVQRLAPFQAALDLDEAYLRALESGGDTLHFPRADQNWSAAQLDEEMQGQFWTAAQPYDPAHPLDVYGDLLHIEDDTWFVYQALDTLEQKVPPVFHEIAADYLARRRGAKRGMGGQHAGIYVAGRKRIPDLDGLGRLRSEKPRGWSKGSTFNDPDGVVSGASVLAVAYTENTDRKRDAVRRTYGQSRYGVLPEVGNPLADAQIDPSAMDHEFGHLLDYALSGSAQAGKAASAERLWRLVHGKVKKSGGRYLSPYFKQSGDAGPQELWADAFGIWAVASGDQATIDGRPHTVLVDDLKAPDGFRSRAVTWRTRAFATEYDIPYQVAFEIEDYFDRLLREVESGKRKPRAKR